MEDLIIIVVGLTTLFAVSYGNEQCNQSSVFPQYSINSPAVTFCTDKDLETEMSLLQKEIEQSCRRDQQSIVHCRIIAPDSSELCDILQRSISDYFLGSLTLPASNCREILKHNLLASSGMYWLRNGDSALVNVTCDFNAELPPADPVRGWQEITNIDVSEDACPSPLIMKEETDNPRRCGKSSNKAGCESVLFQTNQIPFSKLCGHVTGYSSGLPDAVGREHAICANGGCDTIDDPYLDGISITYSVNNNRMHVWSLGVQFVSTASCVHRPSVYNFIGPNYYCDLGIPSIDTHNVHFRRLWVTQKHSNQPCCENANPNYPWFCREFDHPILTDAIEVRVCDDEGFNNEAIFFETLKLYIQ